MSKKSLLLGIVLGGLLAVGGWQVYQHLQQHNTETTLTLYGNVDIRDVVLAFRVSGRIAEMRFEEGDRVNKNTVVATLDRDTFEEDLTVAKAELAEAEAALKNAERDYQRNARLVKSGTVSQSLYDEALANRDTSRARVLTAQARIEQAQTALGDTQIHAPSDGVILTRVREPGSIVNAGQPVYTLAVDNPVWVRTYITEPNLGNIYPGQPARIYTDSRPNKPYQGQVGFISPQAEFTPKNVETTQLRTDLVYRLRVIVDNPDQGLRQGMPVTVKFDKNSLPATNLSDNNDG
jgi:HlyD family secretion protein